MVKAIKGGCEARHPSTFRMSRTKGLPNYVILIVRTYGEFHIGNEFFSVTPPQVIIIAPDTVYDYGNPHGDYMDDWLHFEIEHSPFLQQLQSMCNKPFPIGNHNLFSFYIQQILWELSYGQSPFTQVNMDALFTLLFNHLIIAYDAKDSYSAGSTFRSQLQLLRLEMENSVYEKHSIREYAQKLNVSESYFQYLYKSLFGISFQQDLIQMRVEYAKYIMITSNLTLAQVAEMCGYTNEIHFYRQFKKLVGTTPAKFRKDTELNS
jgi:AraC family transcriptional regulator of arabinose operon